MAEIGVKELKATASAVIDEVEAGAGQTAGFRQFSLQFLYVVLAEVPDPQRISSPDGLGGKHLGDGDQRDLVPPPAASPGRPLQATFQLGQPFAQKLHNYLRLQAGCRY